MNEYAVHIYISQLDRVLRGTLSYTIPLYYTLYIVNIFG